MPALHALPPNAMLPHATAPPHDRDTPHGSSPLLIHSSPPQHSALQPPSHASPRQCSHQSSTTRLRCHDCGGGSSSDAGGGESSGSGGGGEGGTLDDCIGARSSLLSGTAGCAIGADGKPSATGGGLPRLLQSRGDEMLSPTGHEMWSPAAGVPSTPLDSPAGHDEGLTDRQPLLNSSGT